MSCQRACQGAYTVAMQLGIMNWLSYAYSCCQTSQCAASILAAPHFVMTCDHLCLGSGTTEEEDRMEPSEGQLLCVLPKRMPKQMEAGMKQYPWLVPATVMFMLIVVLVLIFFIYG